MARNFEEERKLHQKIIDDNKGNKEIEEAQKTHLKKIDEDEAKAKKKAERKAKIEANLDANDAGAKAVEFQNRMVNGDSVVNKPDEQVEDKSQVVDDVIAGKYGTGVERRTNLQNAGYDPDEIQKLVNDKVNKPAPEAPANDTAIEEQATEDLQNTDNEESDIENFQVGADVSDTELTPEMENELMNSDEGQEAKAAVDANNPGALQNIVTPEGQAVLKGSFDASGHYVPYRYTDEDVGGMSKGMAGALTIISVALAGLGAAAGIPLVPINFYKLFGKPEMIEKANQIEEDYARVVNGEASAKVNAENARNVNREQNVEDINTYKDISDADVQKTAQVNAASAGTNAQLDVQREQQAFDAKMKQIDQDFAKEMNNLNTQSQIDVLKQQGVNQQDLAALMNDLDAQRIMKKIAYAKKAGLTPDETAKWLRAEQGITQFGAAMGYVGDVADVAGKVAGTMLGGGSDKGMKKFDWGKSNTNMLRHSFKWR